MPSFEAPSRRQLIGGAATLTAAAIAAPALAQEAATARPDLSGKSVLVTGSSSGFGRLTVLHAARSGARVFATMRNTDGGRRPEAAELAGIARAENLKIELIELDVTDPVQVAAAVNQAQLANQGALDAVINNAGIGLSGPVELTDEQGLEDIFDVNLFGYMRVARAALPAMRAARKGLIVNVSSQLGRVVIPGVGAYSGTKFAVEAMFEALAYELAPFGVECCIVQPGGYPTNIWRSGERYSDEMITRASDEQRAAYAEFLAGSRRRFAGGGTTDPQDVANAIVEIVAMPEGRRPLRRPVHPNTRATDALNAAHAQVQAMALGNGPFAPWHAAVTD
jgi:NAD(P)-dependent dehydrogenase (short-subunit alcohol dehydrogenase family)